MSQPQPRDPRLQRLNLPSAQAATSLPASQFEQLQNQLLTFGQIGQLPSVNQIEGFQPGFQTVFQPLFQSGFQASPFQQLTYPNLPISNLDQMTNLNLNYNQLAALYAATATSNVASTIPSLMPSSTPIAFPFLQPPIFEKQNNSIPDKLNKVTIEPAKKKIQQESPKKQKKEHHAQKDKDLIKDALPPLKPEEIEELYLYYNPINLSKEYDILSGQKRKPEFEESKVVSEAFDEAQNSMGTFIGFESKNIPLIPVIPRF
ncbi:hypothetical protein HK096_001437 [Nowakowskiella sp. JEL0078]|nr:hypothetical protein HK096_001437 [Nowakowskiella sp. JEL0078]